MSNTDKLREMNSTDALREIAEKHKFGYQEYVDHVVSEYTALISEHYVERAKYDEAVRQRDELKERCDNLENMLWEIELAYKELGQFIPTKKAEAAIKSTER